MPLSLEEARRLVSDYVLHYNLPRPHEGIDGLAPAEQFFGAASEVKKTLQARVAANALELARHGVPKTPFYLTGQVGGKPFSVHAEGERVIMTGAGQERREVELTAPPERKPTEAELPEPICPSGVVSSRVEEGFEEPPAPALATR